jgi:serine protease Do
MKYFGSLFLSASLFAGAPLLAAPAVHAQDETALPPAMEVDFRSIVREAKSKVFPAVVFIRCLQESHMQGERISQEVTGSGVIISPSGEVITNWHVVEKAVRVRCLLSDGRAMEADVVGTDKSTDIALLQLHAEGEGSLPYALFGDSATLVEGDFVMAMGAPFSLNRSVSIGIISCTRRYLDQISEYSLWLQTDAAINPGNSGGPLVNTAGEIIGINARGIDMADAMAFAIPSETVQLLVPQLREHGKVNWSWTGLQLQPLRDFSRDTYFEGDEGVMVAETDPESPARHAGLQPRDRIVAINGVPLTALTEEDLPQARRAVGLLPLGEAVKFEVVRGEERLTFELTPREKGTVEGQELDCPRWDFAAKEINQFDNPDLYFHRKQGVFIYALKYPGNAGNSGLREQDIITRIGDKEIATLDDLKAVHAAAIENVSRVHRLTFHVLRNGLPRQIVLDFSRDHSRR